MPALRAHLPAGGGLSRKEFERRHALLTRLLWVIALVLLPAGLIAGYPIWHAALHAGPVVAFAVLAGGDRGSPRLRSICVTLGLCTTASLIVHLSGGVTEAHFSFFVLVVLLTVYEDWAVLLLTIGFVLAHHVLMGFMEPQAVFHDHAGHLSGLRVWWWAGVHAAYVAATSAAAIIAWSFNESVRAELRAAEAAMQRAAMIDALTGLGNRRALMEHLEGALSEGRPSVFALCDLNEFKPYNDTYGHPAGDALLTRLGGRLGDEAHALGGRAFRLGGDEFCVLLPGSDAEAAAALAELALSDHGEGFAVSCAVGVVLLPAEATSSDAALRVADARMYGGKRGRMSAEAQSTEVLLHALRERHPDLGHDLDDVARLSDALAELLGLSPEARRQVRRAAELHDIGKVAIPDEILSKPSALDEHEWAFIRRHTIIGERILAAAPSLADVATIVRSSHERWDGGGYPDGLAGEAIPLGARIVGVVDAFDAMTSARPYSAPRTPAEALAELQRCAGTQFDPAVVSAFAAVWARPAARAQTLPLAA